MKPNARLCERIRHSLERGRSRVLLSDEQGAWSGQDILDRSAPLQAALLSATETGDHVGIFLPPSAAQAFAILTVLACERVPVILSWANKSSDTQAAGESAGIKILITSPATGSALLPSAQRIVLSGQGGFEVGKATPGPSQPAPTRPGTALILFTSGSTGRPKGVHVPEHGLIKTIEYLTECFGLDAETRSPIVLPICHSMGLNTQFLPTFLAGGESHFVNSSVKIHRIYRSLLEQNGTFVSLIGEVLRICWEEKRRKNLSPAAGVKHVQLAGGMISERHLAMAQELFPGALVHKGYGLTEGIRVSLTNSNSPSFLTPSVGKPLPFVEVKIKTTEDSHAGEIHIKGPNVLLRCSGADLVLDAEGYLATGDIGYWNESGELCVIGRNDSLFKINGFRISGYEIEQIALKSSRLITQSKCLVVEDPERGREKLALFLEINPEKQKEFIEKDLPKVSENILSQFQQLAHFPREVMITSRLPRRTNGKLDIKNIRDAYGRIPAAARPEPSRKSLHFYRTKDSPERIHYA